MISSLADFISYLNEDFLHYCSQSLKGSGLSAAHMAFIIYIGDHPDCSPTQMAKSIDADSGYTTRTVKRLESCDLVSRQSDERDRRSCALRLTDRGQQQFMRIRELHRTWEMRKLGSLDSEEREQLLQIIAKLL